jgi:hypothetical protein
MTTTTTTKKALATDEEGYRYVKTQTIGDAVITVESFEKQELPSGRVVWPTAVYTVTDALATDGRKLKFTWTRRPKPGWYYQGTRHQSYKALAETGLALLRSGAAGSVPAAARKARRARKESALAAVTPEHTEAMATVPEVRPNGNRTAEDDANAQAEIRNGPASDARQERVTNETPLSDLTKLELRGIALTKGLTLPSRANKEGLLEALAAAGMTTWGDTI